MKDAAAQGTRQVAEDVRATAEIRRNDAKALRVIAEHVRELRSEMRASSEQRKLLPDMQEATTAFGEAIRAHKG